MDPNTTMDLSSQSELEFDCPSSREGSITDVNLFERNERARHTSLPPRGSSIFRENNKDKKKVEWTAESFFLRRQPSLTLYSQPYIGIGRFHKIEAKVCKGLLAQWEIYNKLLNAGSLAEFDKILQSSEVVHAKLLPSAMHLEKCEKKLAALIQSLREKLSENEKAGSPELAKDISFLKEQIKERVTQIGDMFGGRNTSTPAKPSRDNAHTLLSKIASKASEPKAPQDDFAKLQRFLLLNATHLEIEPAALSKLELTDLYEKVHEAAKSQLKAARSELEMAESVFQPAQSALQDANKQFQTAQSRWVTKNRYALEGLAEERERDIRESFSKSVESKRDTAQSALERKKSSVLAQQVLLNEIENQKEPVFKAHEAYKKQQEKQKELRTPATLFRRLMATFFNPFLNAYLGLLSLGSLFAKSVRSNWNRLV